MKTAEYTILKSTLEHYKEVNDRPCKTQFQVKYAYINFCAEMLWDTQSFQILIKSPW